MKNVAKHFERGFTLLELLVTISIVAILVAVAVPSMESSNKRGQVKAHQRHFLGALNYARSEAVSRNKLVSMCASNDGATACPPQDDAPQLGLLQSIVDAVPLNKA